MSRYERQVSIDLINLTQALHEGGHTEHYIGGILGGDHGYGTYYENDVFMMHPFCWCEREDCDWCLGCSCPDEAYHHFVGDQEVSGDQFYAQGGFTQPGAHIDKDGALMCDYCTGRRKRAPNFLHKASGTTVEWYKYIGRDMGIRLCGKWDRIYQQCVESLGGAQ